MKALNKLKYPILVIVILVIIKFIGVSKIANTILYMKNGSNLKLNYYVINFPLGHWAYFGESNIAYVLSGTTVNDMVLGIEIFKLPEKIALDSVLEKCEELKKEKFNKNILGDIYSCKRNGIEVLYFQSKDQKIFIRGTDYNSTDKKIRKEYELILKSFSPRP